MSATFDLLKWLDRQPQKEFRLTGELPRYPTPNITITKERLEDFNLEYSMLSAFCAVVCGTTVDKLCKLDLIAFLEKRVREDKDSHDADKCL